MCETPKYHLIDQGNNLALQRNDTPEIITTGTTPAELVSKMAQSDESMNAHEAAKLVRISKTLLKGAKNNA